MRIITHDPVCPKILILNVGNILFCYTSRVQSNSDFEYCGIVNAPPYILRTTSRTLEEGVIRVQAESSSGKIRNSVEFPRDELRHAAFLAPRVLTAELWCAR